MQCPKDNFSEGTNKRYLKCGGETLYPLCIHENMVLLPTKANEKNPSNSILQTAIWAPGSIYKNMIQTQTEDSLSAKYPSFHSTTHRLVVLETPPTTYLPRHHGLGRQEPKSFPHPLLWMISHALNQPKANIILFLLVLSHWNAKEDLVVCSSLAGWFRAQLKSLKQHETVSSTSDTPQPTGRGLNPQLCSFIHPWRHSWNSKRSALPPIALRGIIGIFRSRLMRTQRAGEFCLPTTQCSLQWDY